MGWFEELGVYRKINSGKTALSKTYRPWSDYVCQYKSDAVLDVSTQQFSKTAAIHALYQDFLNHSAVPEAGDLLRAFLTDQGVLFPQTREREYPADRSMRIYSTSGEKSRKEAAKRADPSLSEVDRIVLFAKRAYDKRQQSFEEKYPLITLEKVEYGIHTLIDGREGPVSNHTLSPEYPHLIFHLFRSPIHRYIFNYENRGWNFKRVIEDAYIRNPLPITNQSLAADRDLFLTIVDVCAEICKGRNIVFHRDAWKALWGCIEQSVQCLTYEEFDLFSARNGFSHILHLLEKGSPILDKWIEEKFTSEAQNYIPIWHKLHKKYSNLSRKETGEWNKKLSIFRGLFESATTSSDDVGDYLSEMCTKIKWTGIAFLPSPEELSLIDKSIRPRARSGPAIDIRNGNPVLQKLDSDENGTKEKHVIRDTENGWCHRGVEVGGKTS